MWLGGELSFKGLYRSIYLCALQVSALGTLRRPERTVRQVSRDNPTCSSLERKKIEL